MDLSQVGELAAIGAACCWTITALCYQEAGGRVGSLPVTFVRLPIAMVFISLYTRLALGQWFPLDAPQEAWLWLSVSGLVGLFLGDPGFRDRVGAFTLPARFRPDPHG